MANTAGKRFLSGTAICPPVGQDALFTSSLATFSVSPLSMYYWLTGASRSAFASAGPQHAGVAAERTFRGIFCAS
jgi:hypothetical protein